MPCLPFELRAWHGTLRLKVGRLSLFQIHLTFDKQVERWMFNQGEMTLPDAWWPA